MPIVCINRPNRSKPRRYTCQDVRRIVRYAMLAGVSGNCIVNEVLEETGQKEAICKIFQVIRLIKEVRDSAVFLAVLGALITIVRGIIIIFGGDTRRRRR